MHKRCLLLCFDCTRMFVSQVGCKYSGSYLSWLTRVQFCSMAPVLALGFERGFGGVAAELLLTLGKIHVLKMCLLSLFCASVL